MFSIFYDRCTVGISELFGWFHGFTLNQYIQVAPAQLAQNGRFISKILDSIIDCADTVRVFRSNMVCT